MKIICEWCGKSFERSLTRLKENKRRNSKNVCSRKCRGEMLRAMQAGVGHKHVMVQCAACGKVLEKRLGDYNQKIKHNQEFCCNKHCIGKYRHGKRYKGARMKPRIIDNMKVRKRV